MFSSFHHPVDLMFHCLSCQRHFEKCPFIFDDTVFELKRFLPMTWQAAKAYHTEEQNPVKKSWKFILKNIISTLLNKQEGTFDLIRLKSLFFASTLTIYSAMHRTAGGKPLIGYEINSMDLFLMNKNRKCQRVSHIVRVRMVS